MLQQDRKLMKSLFSLSLNFHAFRNIVGLIARHRHLIWEMAKREIYDRYAGQILGIFWAVGHPLVLMSVYIVIFGIVFKASISGAAGVKMGHAVYLLSGLIPWLAFQEAMSKASSVIVGNSNLVKQVVFPVEILPVKGILATAITESVFLTLLTIYVLFDTRALPLTYGLLPVLFVLQLMAMAGVGFLLSAIGVYFRDIKDFVQVFSMVGVYLLPAFYLPESVPGVFRAILYLNPFSYLVWCYQDVLYFGDFMHPWAWLVFILFSVSTFVLGYRLFAKLKLMFGNML